MHPVVVDNHWNCGVKFLQYRLYKSFFHNARFNNTALKLLFSHLLKSVHSYRIIQPQRSSVCLEERNCREVHFCSKTNGAESSFDLQVGGVRMLFTTRHYRFSVDVMYRSKKLVAVLLFSQQIYMLIRWSDLTEAPVCYNLLSQMNMHLGKGMFCLTSTKIGCSLSHRNSMTLGTSDHQQGLPNFHLR